MANKKIGIITLSASDNCGSLLQAYALKQLLSKYGDVDIIPFTSKRSKEVYALLRGQRLFQTLIYDRQRVKTLPQLLGEKKDYQAFRKKELGIGRKQLLPEDIIKIKSLYDAVVVGSDQVWNVAMWDYDNAFFLGWVDDKCKKIAYAPSLGGHCFDESSEFENIKEWLQRFDAISCRETKGTDYINSILEDACNKQSINYKPINKVLDPTLLLNKEDWKKLIGKPLADGNYIFYYSWAYNDEAMLELIHRESVRTGLPICVVDARKWVYKKPESFGATLCKKGGAYAFLNLMYYAKRCYVESFHGTIFAYLFQKDFWLMDMHEKLTDMDARLKDLVELLDIKDRVLTVCNAEGINQESSVRYKGNSTLATLQESSMQFLSSALGL